MYIYRGAKDIHIYICTNASETQPLCLSSLAAREGGLERKTIRGARGRGKKEEEIHRLREIEGLV